MILQDINTESYKIIIKTAVEKGQLDALLFGFCNKSYAYNILPEKIRLSISRSYFYKLLHDRQISIIESHQSFLSSADKYYKTIEPLIDDPCNLQFNITRLCILQFKEEYQNEI